MPDDLDAGLGAATRAVYLKIAAQRAAQPAASPAAPLAALREADPAAAKRRWRYGTDERAWDDRAPPAPSRVLKPVVGRDPGTLA